MFFTQTVFVYAKTLVLKSFVPGTWYKGFIHYRFDIHKNSFGIINTHNFSFVSFPQVTNKLRASLTTKKKKSHLASLFVFIQKLCIY